MGPAQSFEPEMYMLDAQYQGFFFPRDLIVKTTTPLSGLMTPIKEAVWSVDRNIPIARMRPLQSIIDSRLLPSRFRATLVIAFAGVTLLLAAAGIYGVVAYGVTRRLGEISLRLALGAKPSVLTRGVLLESVLLIVPGLVLGFVASLFAAQLLRTQLFEIRATDPATYIAATVIMVLIALLGSWAPSRRAARVDPARVLMME
jgi:ABC-type antimicrobial peptide transport system permease subunit